MSQYYVQPYYTDPTLFISFTITYTAYAPNPLTYVITPNTVISLSIMSQTVYLAPITNRFTSTLTCNGKTISGVVSGNNYVFANSTSAPIVVGSQLTIAVSDSAPTTSATISTSPAQFTISTAQVSTTVTQAVAATVGTLVTVTVSNFAAFSGISLQATILGTAYPVTQSPMILTIPPAQAVAAD
jgi:hypothetical protein